MIRDVLPGSGSRIRILIFLPIPAPGVKKAPAPGSTTLNSPTHFLTSLRTAYCHLSECNILRVLVAAVSEHHLYSRIRNFHKKRYSTIILVHEFII